jgi:DNA-binding transcriptional MerR regulator
MTELLTTDELLDRTSEMTSHLEVADARIAHRFTERNCRYYVSLGLVRSPLRVQGKSMWTEDHVRDLVRIRRAQSAGQSLSEIGPPVSRPNAPTWKLSNIGVNRSVVTHAFQETVAESDGWAFQISPNIHLTGFTPRPPTQQELQRVTDALSALLTSSSSDNDPLEQQKGNQ